MSFLTAHQLAVLICDQDYPTQPAFSLLTKILDVFISKVRLNKPDGNNRDWTLIYPSDCPGSTILVPQPCVNQLPRSADVH